MSDTIWTTDLYLGYLGVKDHPVYRGPCAYEHRACPYCDSEDVEWKGDCSTLVGLGPDGLDPNHHWSGWECRACGKSFSRQHVVSENATWYVDGDGLLLMGEVGCDCQTHKRPYACGAWLLKTDMNGRTSDPRTPAWIRWGCQECQTYHDMKMYDTGLPVPRWEKLMAKRTLESGFVYAPYMPAVRDRPFDPKPDQDLRRKPRALYKKDMIRPDYYGLVSVNSCDPVIGDKEPDNE